jgi:hypothetical protein
MNILFWAQHDTRSLGGVEVLTRTLAEGLLARGHQVALIAGQTDRGQPRHEIIDGLPVHRFPFFEALTSRSAAAIGDIVTEIRDLKRAFRADVIQINFTDAGPFFHLRTLDRNTASVVSFHDAPSQAPSSWPVARALALRAQAIVAPSRFLAGDIGVALGIAADGVRIIEWGVGMDRLLDLPPPQRCASSRPRALWRDAHVGRL